MKQYLLAVQVDYAHLPPSEEEMQPTYDAVGAFNDELQSSGAWVFAGGLHPPSTATVAPYCLRRSRTARIFGTTL